MSRPSNHKVLGRFESEGRTTLVMAKPNGIIYLEPGGLRGMRGVNAMFPAIEAGYIELTNLMEQIQQHTEATNG